MQLSAIQVPKLVRMKRGALDRVGLYLERERVQRIAVLHSDGLLDSLMSRLNNALHASRIEVAVYLAVREAAFEVATGCLAGLPRGIEAVVGMGGGRALDVAKYVAFLANLPLIAVPTSLSNDGFCSPQSSLTLGGKKRAMHARLPHGVVVDTQVCLEAPQELWLSGVGDLVAKITAVRDWKLAFHACGETVNDLAALLSDSSVYQFMARPQRDKEGMRSLGTALMLNGIAMEIHGSSRPASGSEHMISHALDMLGHRPRLHGIQVGVATYLVALVQENEAAKIAELLERVGFWDHIYQQPFERADWFAAIDAARELRPERYTILNLPETRSRLRQYIEQDTYLRRCIV
jgi:glycerol-1-phosphate dehydrogenase [NAD(P)+]